MLKAGFYGRHGKYPFIRLYSNGERHIALHRVIWIVGTGSPIPEGWEIHHWDEDVMNTAFDNLLCLHPNDHRKFHRDVEDEEMPF